MTQVSKLPVTKDVQKRMYEIFLDALADVRTRGEGELFINDFFTPTERVMLPKRLAIALLLSKGYEQRLISKFLKVSFTTITRISNILQTQGAGYKRVLGKIIADEKMNDFLEKIDDTLAKKLNPVGPRGTNWSEWYAQRRKNKMELKRPF